MLHIYIYDIGRLKVNIVLPYGELSAQLPADSALTMCLVALKVYTRQILYKNNHRSAYC